MEIAERLPNRGSGAPTLVRALQCPSPGGTTNGLHLVSDSDKDRPSRKRRGSASPHGNVGQPQAVGYHNSLPLMYMKTDLEPFGGGGVPMPNCKRGPRNTWVSDAILELAEIDFEADAAGDPQPEAVCKIHAERILRDLARLDLSMPAVYPGESGEVEILFQNRKSKSGVLVSCEPQGSAACYVSVTGRTRRARYDDASDLPDSFLTYALIQVTGGQ